MVGGEGPSRPSTRHWGVERFRPITVTFAFRDEHSRSACTTGGNTYSLITKQCAGNPFWCRTCWWWPVHACHCQRHASEHKKNITPMLSAALWTCELVKSHSLHLVPLKRCEHSLHYEGKTTFTVYVKCKPINTCVSVACYLADIQYITAPNLLQ